MSRIGKLAVAAPAGVDIKVTPELITVKGPKGELKMILTEDVSVKFEKGEVHVFADLGFVMGMMKPMIEREINRHLDEQIA